ncbi:NAD-dependent epimerase/dehydratase family protein [Flagellimonas sp.]|uniref:NAD-dependent epimerase/dehydratase family protein n=1 Tax=Flagellimonas sp. TaxID=2058762 RepID=UPI003B5C51DE
MERRDFIHTSGLASLALGLAPLSACLNSDSGLKILVLGGTNYLGPAIVNQALAMGHEITLFNRGITNPDLYPNLEKLKGNRTIEKEDLSALEGDRKWDIVIDTWTADPRMINKSTQLLKNRVKKYVFVSSIAVYKDKTVVGITETSPLHEVTEFKPGMSYYQSKVLCETAVKNAFPENHVIVRPPGIFGKRDESWSLVYWLWRVRAGGPVLAPGDGTDFVQWIDVRDVAHFLLHAMETNLNGIYNTIGPTKEPLVFKEFLERINTHFGNRADFIWVDDEFLAEQNLRPIVDIPIWEPKTGRAGRHTMSAKKAIQAGMSFTPMEQTFDSALNWYDYVKSSSTDPAIDKSRPFNGITRTKELELLEIWKDKIAS